MIECIDVDARLNEYSEAFDFYMEFGKMPDGISEEDYLATYMREVIDSNPLIDGSDPSLVEILKDELISFFTALLERFRTLQLETMKELEMISRFTEASIRDKRLMWHEVSTTITSRYSKYEVNMPGFTEQFRDGDKEAIFAALTSDWENACKERLNHSELQIFERSKQKFDMIRSYACNVDYEDQKRIENFVYSFPQLKEIVDMIGRDHDSVKEEIDSITCKFIPVTVSKNTSIEDIDHVESGNDLERVLPAEWSMPDDLFYKRFVTKELQQFSSPGKYKPKKMEENRKEPRLTKGPIIVSIDTSCSMTGRPLKIAYSLLKQLLRMAKRQKRPCFLINFSIRAKSIDLSKPRNWGKVNHFLEHSFTGGTDGEQMLAEAINILRNDTYEMADVLIISDFEFPLPIENTMDKIKNEKSLGTRFYGLKIGQYGVIGYNDILDRIWVV